MAYTAPKGNTVGAVLRRVVRAVHLACSEPTSLEAYDSPIIANIKILKDE